MTDARTYIQTDEQGAMRVGHTGVSLDSVVIGFQQGHSPETIRQQYPSLTLEEVYGAITYYLANQDLVEQYLDRQQELWDELRQKAKQDPSPVVERLRKLRKANIQEPQ